LGVECALELLEGDWVRLVEPFDAEVGGDVEAASPTVGPKSDRWSVVLPLCQESSSMVMWPRASTCDPLWFVPIISSEIRPTLTWLFSPLSHSWSPPTRIPFGVRYVIT